MKFIYLIVVFTFLIAGSCKQQIVKMEMLSAIAEADSAIVMYYHKKGDPRFYNIIKVKGINPMPFIHTDVNSRIIDVNDACITEGKIYFYGEAGAVETVYFSLNADCMTLSFIKTGVKYFTKMSRSSKDLLDSLEKNVIILQGRKE